MNCTFKINNVGLALSHSNTRGLNANDKQNNKLVQNLLRLIDFKIEIDYEKGEYSITFFD